MRIDVGLGHVLDEDEGKDDEGVSVEQLQGSLLVGQPVLVVLDTLHVPLLLQNLVQAAAVHSRGWSDGARSSWPLVSTLQDEGWPQDRPLSPELDPLGLPLGVGEVFNVIGVN